MATRDYRQELGLKPATSKVPWPIAGLILVALGALVWYAVSTSQSGLGSGAPADASIKPS